MVVDYKFGICGGGGLSNKVISPMTLLPAKKKTKGSKKVGKSFGNDVGDILSSIPAPHFFQHYYYNLSKKK